MRLRDLGGLIVVDFIDMEESKNRREVETRLRDALRSDRARVQFSSISKFGLLEMSRQRLRPALSEGSHITCPRCNGTGHIRDTESSALQILRMVQEESMKDNTAAVHVQVPVEVTSFLLNEKRTEITKIELKQRVTVLLVPNKALETPNYRLERLRHDDPRLENLQASYTMIDEPEEEVGITRREKAKAKQEPVIKGILPETPAPQAAPKPEPTPVAAPAPVAAAPASAPAAPAGSGFFAWVKRLFSGESAQPVVEAAVKAPEPAAKSGEGRGDRDRNRGARGERGERGGRDGRRGERGGERGERGGDRGGEGRENREGRDGRRGPRPERAARGDEAAPRSDAPRNDAETQRGEGRAEAREGRDGARDNRGGEGRRGPRPEREPRRPEALAEGEAAVPNQAFVDTQPSAEGAEAGEAQGERQGRRRNRRGGRGRDRDDANIGTGPNGGEQAAVTAESGAEAVAADSIDTGVPAGDAAPREGGEGRRRGRGRDRNRRERGEDGNVEGAPQDQVASDAADAPVQAAAVAEMAPVQASAYAPAAAAYTGSVTTEAPASEQRVEPDTRFATIAPAAHDEPVAAPVAVAAAPAPVEAFVLPLDRLQAVAESAGLQWVNSDAEKIRAVQAAMAAEPKPVHVPRERKPLERVDEGPLVLVETRKDLTQFKLPFETAQGSQPQA
jgi:ribonuclease E